SSRRRQTRLSRDWSSDVCSSDLPAYDVCFAYRPDSKWVSQHNLSINGKRKNFTRKDLLTIAEQNSIRNPEGIINSCIEVVANWKMYAEMYQVDEKKTHAINQLLLKKLK